MLEMHKGNIFSNETGILCQQVNCQNHMGSGFAQEVIQRFPTVKSEFHAYCSGQRPSDLLGQALFVFTNGLVIANLFGQLYYGRDGRRYTDYDAVAEALVEVHTLAMITNLPVLIAQGMGCGLAGGQWDIVRAIIEEIFAECQDTRCQIWHRD